MSKINKRQIAKNVGSSWFSLGFDVLVGLFLSPFLVHWLGDTAFGIWVLIFSVTGYYGLFDLGIRSSIVRYVSKFTATDDLEDLAKLVNTSLFTYSCIGLLSLLVTGVLAIYVDHIFKIPPEFHSTARWLLLMVGTSVGLGFPLGVVGGYLDGLQRFYVNNWANIAGDIARLVLIVLAVRHGRGLLTIAAITVTLPLILSLIRGVIAYRILPVPFGYKYVDRATFRTMANYSSVTLIIMIATQLKFKTDNIVIGTMISAAAVTYFSFGARIVSYAQQVVTSLAQNFLPLASQSEATGNMDRLRKVFLAGNRFCAFTSFPITLTLLMLGKSVIEVWVGKKYVAISYPISATAGAGFRRQTRSIPRRPRPGVDWMEFFRWKRTMGAWFLSAIRRLYPRTCCWTERPTLQDRNLQHRAFMDASGEHAFGIHFRRVRAPGRLQLLPQQRSFRGSRSAESAETVRGAEPHAHQCGN